VLLALLARLGFVETVVYEKRRETWQVGVCEVVLDELPQLGWFAEIEGPSESAVRECRTKLALDSEAIAPESYVELAARHGVRMDGTVALRFSLRAPQHRQQAD
jgi:adenylate cyclase class IV